MKILDYFALISVMEIILMICCVLNAEMGRRFIKAIRILIFSIRWNLKLQVSDDIFEIFDRTLALILI